MYIWTFFFEKTQEVCVSFHWTGRKHRGTTSRRRDTHTTVLTKQLQLGKEVPSTDRNDIRPRLALPPAKNGEATRLGATWQWHRLCQTPPGTFQLQGCLGQRTSHPLCLESRQLKGRASAGTGVELMGFILLLSNQFIVVRSVKLLVRWSIGTVLHLITLTRFASTAIKICTACR
jgi:hypothetical protein